MQEFWHRFVVSARNSLSPRPVILLLIGLALVGNSTTPVAQAQGLPMRAPDGFTVETVGAGLGDATSFAIAPDGRIFVTTQRGRIRVIQNGVVQPEDFFDLSFEVNATHERGLMGIAVHPRFPATPYIYLAYVYEPPEAQGYSDDGARVSRVLRLSADPNNLNKAVPGSGVVILGKNSTFANIGNPATGDQKPFSCVDANGGYVQDCLPDEGTSHSVDFMVFGRDGALYVSAGDGINFNSAVNIRAQNPDSPVGKILRINPLTGEGYANNPFYDGNPNSNRSKVYAVGLRNPFRFALHPGNGNVYVGDVGNFDWEEINVGGAGANFGWPCLEGPKVTVDDNGCQGIVSGAQPVTHALYAYPHEKGLSSVIGGDFYTGKSYPAIYRNVYFFGDFSAGKIFTLTFAGGGSVVVNEFATGVPGLVQISAGLNGDLYVLSYTGVLVRLRYTAAGGAAAAGQNAPAAGQNAAVAAPAKPASVTGRINREWWLGIAGNTVADLTKSPKFAGKPSGSEFMSSLEAPLSFANDFGERIFGYLHPPASGEYRFWIAADDAAELWLSATDNPANKQRIALVPAWTTSQQWDKYGEQQSVPIKLEAGKRYYIEILHKDADQKDNLAVAWQIPGGERAVVEGKYLSPFKP